MTLSQLGPKAITDDTFITRGFEMFSQLGPLLHLGPNVITDRAFITLGSSYYTFAFYKGLFPEPVLSDYEGLD